MKTTTEKTLVYKSHYGWMAETTTTVNGQDYRITTMKRSNGQVSCNSQAGTLMDGGFSCMPMTDESINLISEKAIGNEKKIREIHTKGLLKFDELKGADAPAQEKDKPYEVTIGQVLFTEMSGPEDRRAVYEIGKHRSFKTVLLDGSDIRHDSHVRDIKEKFGIGVYYKQGDVLSQDQVDDLLITAHQNIKKRKDEEHSAQILRDAERAAKIEEGMKLVTIPDGATHIIVAELQERDHDPYADYTSSHTTMVVYLAYSFHGKDLFTEMRKAAENYENTQHLGIGKGIFEVYVANTEDHNDGSRNYKDCSCCYFSELSKTFTTRDEAQAYIDTLPAPPTLSVPDREKEFSTYYKIDEKSIEHREKYSMGAGYYLSTGFRSGWTVSKERLGDYSTGIITEQTKNNLYVAAAEGRYFCHLAAKAEQPEARSSVKVVGIQVTHNVEKNGVEIRFESKPSASVLATLKDARWRWSGHGKCWYTRYSTESWELAQSLSK